MFQYCGKFLLVLFEYPSGVAALGGMKRYEVFRPPSFEIFVRRVLQAALLGAPYTVTSHCSELNARAEEKSINVAARSPNVEAMIQVRKKKDRTAGCRLWNMYATQIGNTRWSFFRGGRAHVVKYDSTARSVWRLFFSNLPPDVFYPFPK